MLASIHRPDTRRRGTIVALMAITIVGMIAFLGLAIDLGMLAIAKTQAQQAADLAALTAARTVNGDSTNTYNSAAATINAQNILTYNTILGQSVNPTHNLTIAYGSYDYNQWTQLFNANYPPTSGAPYTAVAATVTTTSLPGEFSRIFGSQFLPNVSATAQAVHRPRDIALVMDLSGSMRFGTLLGFDFYTSTRTSNNPDTVIPTFGHYSSSSANLKGPTTSQTSGSDNYTITPSNTTVTNSSYSLTYINSFYQSAAYASTLIRAFDSYSSTDGGKTWTAPTTQTPQLPASTFTTTPGGDQFLFKSGSTTTYAQTVKDVVGSANRNQWWELDGYAACTNGAFNGSSYLTTATYSSGINATGQANTGAFTGYTKGPGYYGKTFFIWPPDPRRPLNTGTATSWSSTANDTITIKQFLVDFGYTAADFNNSAVATTLNGAITSSATTITVNNYNTTSPNFPSTVPFRIVVGTEVMIVTAVSGSGNKTWTVTRHADGTTAAAATTNAPVGLATRAPLAGIYSSTTQSGSQSWPWPTGDDTKGTITGSLSKYLVTNVYKPGPSNAKLTTSDQAFNNIMRLYNWDYVVSGGTVGTQTAACDWRIRFFGTDSTSVLVNGSGSLNPPGTSGMCSALATYNAILTWIAQSTDPFPTQLRAGRVKYYGTIPTSITGTWPNYGSTDQRFWVELIDYILGFRQTSAGNYQDISGMAGYGSDFNWGTVQKTTTPTLVDPITGSPSSTQNVYMNYQDNPARPLLRHWFSPILMVDFLHNYNLNDNLSNYFYMQPADSYEAPLYTAKQAYVAAIVTMKNNHPNDWVTVVPYSWPRTSGGDSTHRLNGVCSPLGTNYTYATASLLFPPSTINADGTCNNTEITPYDADPATGNIPSANFMDTPRADGDTCFAMGLMLCYNQFQVTATTDNTLRSFTSSSPITFPTGMAGGMGRKGAQKVIIFETDGMANCSATASLVSASGYSYYKIRYDMNNPYGSEFPSINPTGINDPTVLSQVNSLVQQLATDCGTARNPFRLYAIGFGPVFQGADASMALSTLQTMQYYAGTQSSASTALASNQIITGTDAQMLSNMTSAFTSILQNGIQIALIK